MQVPSSRLGRRRLAVLAAGALAAAATAVPVPAADAFFAVARCGGGAITGTGATFAGNAHDAYSLNFRTTAAGCPNHPLIDYVRTGSGAGRAAVGAGGSINNVTYAAGQRANPFRFGTSDAGLTQAQINTINGGPSAGAEDNAVIRQIPMASGAVTPTVNIPNRADNGQPCALPTAFTVTRAGQTRLAVPNFRLERAWAGLYATWEDFVPGIDAANPDAANCGEKPLVRVVRADDSGTTFAWKDYLNEAAKLAGASGINWRNGTPIAYMASGSSNRAWPNTRQGSTNGGATVNDISPALGYQTADSSGNCSADYVAGTAPFTANGNAETASAPATGSPVCRVGPNGNTTPQVAGNNPQARLLKRTDGAIAYTELAAAVEESLRLSATNSDVYMMPLAVRTADVPGGTDNANYVEPTANANGFIEGNATGGSNCQTVPVNNVPGGADPTTGPWNPVSMVLPTSGYSACSLTYLLVFSDMAPAYLNIAGNTYDTEERRARAVKDYVDYIVSDAGQATLVANDYSPLGGAALLAARDGASRIDWDVAGVGDPNRGKTTVTNPPDTGGGGGGGGGGGTTPAAPTPPTAPPTTQQPPSNVFSLPSARRSGNRILLGVRVPGAGRIVVRAVGTYTERVRRSGRTRTVRRSVTVGSATVSPTRAGDVQLRLNVARAARSALGRGRDLRVAITAEFTPAGGTAATQRRSLTLRGTKPRRSRS